MMVRLALIIVLGLLIDPAQAQLLLGSSRAATGVGASATLPVFNCSAGFSASTSSPCYTTIDYPYNGIFAELGAFNGSEPVLVGTQINMINAAAQHNANNVNYQPGPVGVTHFTTTFTFVPNGQNASFVLSNNNTSAGGIASSVGGFTGGAGCEGSFFQGFNNGGPGINNTFAVELDSYSGNAAGQSTFSYSNVQYYDVGHPPPNAPNGPGQSPCNPDLGSNITGFTYVGVNKISTSPVALNSPANTLNTTTGDTYSVTIAYDGSNLTLNMYDVTAGGSCPGATCFTNTWTSVNIPAIVGGSTAYLGFAGATGSGVNSPGPLILKSWSFQQ